MACLVIGLVGCSEPSIDRPSGDSPDTSDLSGLVHLSSIEDYTPENHTYILQDDEPESVFLDQTQRSFDPRNPVQVSVTGKQELMVRSYSPRRIKNFRIWASVEGYPDEFLLAQFDIMPPFVEFKTVIPFVAADKEYVTSAGNTILIVANPHLGADDLSLRIDCEDPYYKKFSTIKTTWTVRFSNFEWPNHPYWQPMSPAHCREAIAMTMNMAYIFSTQDYVDSLNVNNNRFVDNSESVLSAETLLSQSRTRPNFAWGTLHIQGGLGGGGTLGLQDVCFLGHYPDDAFDTMALFHEFGHGMGYGHGPNTVISESGGKHSWRKMCQNLYLRMALEKELPIYSRRFMHSRRNHYDSWNENRLAYYGAAGRYYAGRYVIEDPELDEIDGGLSGGNDFLATDFGGNTGEALEFKLNYENAGIEQADYAPMDVYVYGDRLYLTNDIRQADYSIDVFDISGGSPKLLKRFNTYKDPESGEEKKIGKPTGIFRSYDKVYVTGFDNRILVFDEDMDKCLNLLSPSGGAFAVAVSEGVVYGITDRVRAIPEHWVSSEKPGSLKSIAQTDNLQMSSENTLARDHKGNVYASLNNAKKIVRIDKSRLMSGRLETGDEIKFEHSPKGVCFSEDGRMFVSFGKDAGVKFAQVNPKTGNIIADFTKIGDIELKNPVRCLIQRGTLFIVERHVNGKDVNFCVYALPVDRLK